MGIPPAGGRNVKTFRWYHRLPAEIGRDPVNKHQIQPERGDEQADAGRDCRTRLHARPKPQALILEVYYIKHFHIMHACMVTHIARVWINRVRLPVLHVVSWTGKMNISLSTFAPEN